MKSNKFGLAASIMLLAVSSSVWANSENAQGWYAGFGVGNGSPDINAVAPKSITSDSSTVYDGVIGYQFNKNFAMESQYTGIGKVKDNNGGSAKGDAASLAAVGILPVGKRFDLYGKLGYANTKTKLSNFGAGDASRSDATYGLGVQYNINPMISTRLGWDHYGIATKNAATGDKEDADSNVTTLNVIYNF